MNNSNCIDKLNSILKCSSKKKKIIKTNNIKYENKNGKYLSTTNYIGRKYIEKLINECDDLRNNNLDNTPNSKIKNYDGRDKNNDIEYAKSSNLEIDNKLCKVKGTNLHEGRAGLLNEVIIETLNNLGECIYLENCEFEAFVKSKDEVDNLNYIKESSDKENGYDVFIINNLYNKYHHQKHHDLINLNYNKYNINSIFSNYKNIKEKKINEKDELFYELNEQNFFSKSEKNQENKNFSTEKSKLLNKTYGFCEENQLKKNTCYNESVFREKNAYSHENNNYNETIKKCYIFSSSEYDEENIKLVKNSLKCNIRDLKDGTYKVSFSIRKSGYYYLSIFYKKKPVANSPYLIHIKPSTAYAPNCIVYKNKNNKILIPTTRKKKKYIKKNRKNAKKEINIHNYLSNIYNNSFHEGEFNLTDSYSDNEINSGTAYNTDNSYCSSFSSRLISSSESDNNDYETNSQSNSEVNMNILKFYDEEEEDKIFSNFFIQSYDAYNNKINEGNNTYEVTGLGAIKITEINNLKNGIYEVVYKYLSNNNSKNCSYNNYSNNTYREIKVTLNGFHVKGSPFRIILKSDKNTSHLNRIKNLLPIDHVNTVNLTQSILNIMNSYKYIKGNYLSDDHETNYMNIYPYYKKEELHKILKKIDKNLISLMELPVKHQIFNYIKYINDDKEIVKLKKTLFKELLVANSKMVNCANIFNEDFEEDKQNLMKGRDLQEETIKEIKLMYESLKEKNIHTLPFNFAIKDMKLYEEELSNKKKELLEKQNKLIERYNTLKSKEKKFYEDREHITKELRNKYQLHQTIYECSQDALIENNNNLKKITISNIKKNYKNEKKLLALKNEKGLSKILSIVQVNE